MNPPPFSCAIPIFPGVNCHRELILALERICSSPPHLVPHTSQTLPDVQLVAIAGGFTYGDYLRAGAVAARTPVMNAVKQHAQNGGLVLGVCNGFQILTEAHLLPGALVANESGQFVHQTASLLVANNNTPFSSLWTPNQTIRLPISHYEGRFVAPHNQLQAIENNNQVLFRYLPNHNPNGSFNDVAGIVNKTRNVCGLMPHPERNASLLPPPHNIPNPPQDGFNFFRSLAQSLASAPLAA